MAFYTVSPFLGPELGPLVSGFINQNTTWRWTYYLLIIWSFLQVVALVCFVPETYVPVILKQKAQRLREMTGNQNYYAPLEKENASLGRAIIISCYRPFRMPYPYFLLRGTHFLSSLQNSSSATVPHLRGVSYHLRRKAWFYLANDWYDFPRYGVWLSHRACHHTILE